MIPGVVDPPEIARVGLTGGRVGLLELGQQRIGSSAGELHAAAAVEQLIDPEVVGGRPGRGIVDIARALAQRRRGVVVGRVSRRVPAVVGEEVVVDVRIEIVALVAEVDPARRPGQRAVAQELGLQLVLVLVKGLDHLLDAVGMRVDAHQRGVARSGDQRVEVRRADRSRLVTERPGVHRDRALQRREHLLPVGRQRSLNAVKRARRRSGCSGRWSRSDTHRR